MKEIDKKIKRYYESKSLSKDQIDRIVGKVDKEKKVQGKPWKSLLKYAAVFCLFVACFFLYQNFSFNNEGLLEKYGKEVAFNHLKNLDSDILTKDIGDLNDKMDKLNFDVIIPENINSSYSLLGGRYCSIDERLAAQLKLKDKKTDVVVTLYVLDKLKSENFNNSFVVDSTSIQIWNSHSNLFVLASDVSK